MSLFVNRTAANAARQAQLAAASRNLMSSNKGWSTTGKVLTGTAGAVTLLHFIQLAPQLWRKEGIMDFRTTFNKYVEAFNTLQTKDEDKKKPINFMKGVWKSFAQASHNLFYPHKAFTEKPVKVDIQGDGHTEFTEMEEALKNAGVALPQ